MTKTELTFSSILNNKSNYPITLISAYLSVGKQTKITALTFFVSLLYKTD